MKLRIKIPFPLQKSFPLVISPRLFHDSIQTSTSNPHLQPSEQATIKRTQSSKGSSHLYTSIQCFDLQNVLTPLLTHAHIGTPINPRSDASIFNAPFEFATRI